MAKTGGSEISVCVSDLGRELGTFHLDRRKNSAHPGVYNLTALGRAAERVPMVLICSGEASGVISLSCLTD